MCPIGVWGWGAVLLALSGLGLVLQAWKYRLGSGAARGLLLGWGLWLWGVAGALAQARLGEPATAGPLAVVAVGLLLATAWVVYRDWRAATQARRAAEAAIDRQVQARLAQLWATAADEEERP